MSDFEATTLWGSAPGRGGKTAFKTRRLQIALVLVGFALVGGCAATRAKPAAESGAALAEQAALTLPALGIDAGVAGAIALPPVVQAWDAAPAAVYPVGAAEKVLELGLFGWRTFDDQLSLRLLWKWVDPASGRVTGRGSAERTLVDAEARASLTTDGAAFKDATLKLGGELFDDGLSVGFGGRR